MAQRRTFGNVRKLKSGKFQARYTGPDGRMYSARTVGGWTSTFDTKGRAEAALSKEHTAIQEGTWAPPPARGKAPAGPKTVRAYADDWVTTRPIEESTREHYRRLLNAHIYPTFADVAVVDVEPEMVRNWHARLAPGKHTVRAHAYSLFKTIMTTAVDDGIRADNPCRVRGASYARRARPIRPVEPEELDIIVASMPARYRLMVLLATWCAFRFGELAEMRRGDVDVKAGVIRVRRGVARLPGRAIVKGPKSEAGKRDVHIPPHLIPAVKEHLRAHVAIHREALLWPAASDPNKHLHPMTLKASFFPARERAGRPDLRFHDLRHSGAVLAAQIPGTTVKDLMARLGHSTPSAALRYQHTAAKRDKGIAEALSKMAGREESA